MPALNLVSYSESLRDLNALQAGHSKVNRGRRFLAELCRVALRQSESESGEMAQR